MTTTTSSFKQEPEAAPLDDVLASLELMLETPLQGLSLPQVVQLTRTKIAELKPEAAAESVADEFTLELGILQDLLRQLEAYLGGPAGQSLHLH